MRMRRCLERLVGGLFFFLAACSHSPSRELVQEFGDMNQSPARFGVCKGYGCKTMVRITLTARDWQTVREAFGPRPETPVAEREAIRRAIGRIERLAGPRTNTANDKPGAKLLNFQSDHEMDCIDESFNTTTYLRFLAQDGLLLWHDVGEPVRRGSFVDGWPHNTATIMEKDAAGRRTGREFAVDSWFHGNGVPPEIVKLPSWKSGWSPKTIHSPCHDDECAENIPNSGDHADAD